jgi:hypothetical protein
MAGATAFVAASMRFLISPAVVAEFPAAVLIFAPWITTAIIADTLIRVGIIEVAGVVFIHGSIPDSVVVPIPAIAIPAIAIPAIAIPPAAVPTI